MTIYKGSDETTSLNIGETEIGQVYKGSELVWQKANNTEITLYQYGGNRYLYVMDNMINNALFSYTTNGWGNGPSYNTISSITGNIGQENSEITVAGTVWKYYKDIYTPIDNKLLYIYTAPNKLHPDDYNYIGKYLYVLPNAVIGTTCLMCNLGDLWCNHDYLKIDFLDSYFYTGITTTSTAEYLGVFEYGINTWYSANRSSRIYVWNLQGLTQIA